MDNNLFLFDFCTKLHFTETLSNFLLNKSLSFHVKETLTLFEFVLSIEVYKLCLFYVLRFLFWKDRLKMKTNDSNGEYPNDFNNEDVRENLTETPNQKSESAAE